MSPYLELQPQRAGTCTLPRTFLPSAQLSFPLAIDAYDSDTDYSVIVESSITTEGLVLSAFTERKDSSVLEGPQTEGHRDIASPDKVLLSAPFCEFFSL
jgi:hypothetical protein